MLIYVITDRRVRPDLDRDRLIAAVAGCRADMIQIREKDLSVAALLRSVLQARAGAGEDGPEVYVNGRPDVALAARATGVHLPTSGLPPSAVRARWGRALRLGVSTHALSQALAAQTEGADFITFGPVFETASKRAYGPPVGVEALEAALAAVRIPVFAIGGINRSNIGELAGLPLVGVAVISSVLLAPDMEAAVEELRDLSSRQPRLAVTAAGLAGSSR